MARPGNTSEVLDLPNNAVRVRQRAMVLRIDTHTSRATVVYHHGDQFCQASARAVTLAGQGYTAQHVVGHLLDEATRQAWQSFVYVPVVTANVVRRRAAALVDLGLGYNTGFSVPCVRPVFMRLSRLHL